MITERTMCRRWEDIHLYDEAGYRFSRTALLEFRRLVPPAERPARFARLSAAYGVEVGFIEGLFYLLPADLQYVRGWFGPKGAA